MPARGDAWSDGNRGVVSDQRVPGARQHAQFAADRGDPLVEKQKREDQPVVHRVALPDGSQFLYRTYDVVNERFQDIFWIHTFDDVYRVKSLRPQQQPLVGEHVEHFQRSDKGEVILVEATESQVLPGLHFDARTLDDVLISAGDRSLTALWKSLPPSGQTLTNEQAQVAAALIPRW